MRSLLEKDRKLGRNELMGKLGTHSLSFTLDTGADVTVVPKEFVDDSVLTGDQVIVQSASGHSIPMKTAAIELDIGGHKVNRTAAICSGSELGGVGLLSFDICDPDHLSLFTNLAKQVMTRVGGEGREGEPGT